MHIELIKQRFLKQETFSTLKLISGTYKMRCYYVVIDHGCHHQNTFTKLYLVNSDGSEIVHMGQFLQDGKNDQTLSKKIFFAASL